MLAAEKAGTDVETGDENRNLQYWQKSSGTNVLNLHLPDSLRRYICV